MSQLVSTTPKAVSSSPSPSLLPAAECHPCHQPRLQEGKDLYHQGQRLRKILHPHRPLHGSQMNVLYVEMKKLYIISILLLLGSLGVSAKGFVRYLNITIIPTWRPSASGNTKRRKPLISLHISQNCRFKSLFYLPASIERVEGVFSVAVASIFECGGIGVLNLLSIVEHVE